MTGHDTRRDYSAHDEERWAPEDPKSGDRTAFERDRARLIHSSALRRLGAKSQILMAGTDDFARTRLTHTLEVAQIGRQIAQMFGCDPDVVDCACLAHDLGHPPFGHNGEHALARIAEPIGGFEGNAQTLRILTRLEPKVFFHDGRSAGVNLTRACLDASVKYPWDYAHADDHPKGERSRKFGVYPSDEPAFRWLRQGAPGTATPMECQIMDLSDDIAYSVHDVEDAIATGACDPAQLRDARVLDAVVEQVLTWYGRQWDPDELLAAFGRLQRRHTFPERFDGSRHALAQLKNVTSTLIGTFAHSVEAATRDTYGTGPLVRYRANVVVPPHTRYEILALKGIAVHFLMEPREHSPLHGEEQRIITDLVDVLMADAPQPSLALEPVFWEDWANAESDGERLRVAVDQVASLTDGSAMTLHELLCS
ncbi:deoxyguanosinetriphosphate triphosphohydrolase [Bifidobacterium pseudolongum subsp. pseudolongum]|uniref:Deoxyguanosinetriphosphate triphosphohydrolase n=1 Tax=Bifidobacterium pseudolongum subsp. globosum TaxID=1690 RepID=A0AB37X6Q9_9BIFI|nr:deoxyguanosinetriphosphate triphosphohydrolase [Bifidobacterium pseudolongum]PKV08389.1 deoxyguanosinetriphosphate triphosphohydrolase [Bifidobacterium pseudolongum subsp. pseudolongum]RYQ38492.1 deoxyguanosinetriphosphate triphosphohydrolase [Bifidobacterium pseudolongum subsp. globosum]RYQ49576.1 deoxyguanosinetriphosphate triphosphohydrolase [Bifidobacterium pseudolongum subsp. pseudolongum]